MGDAPARSRLALAAGLFVSVGASAAAAAIGGLATVPAIGGWYRSIRKPAWNPPEGAFGPAWTVLYLAMAAAAWDVWRRSQPGGAKGPLALHAVQLALNAAWSLIFFGLQRPGWALAEMTVLWALILATLVEFARRSRLAGGLYVPYLLWVTFAWALNAAIVAMNP